MSTPSAEKSIQMLEEMLVDIKNGRYKYNIGDICELYLKGWDVQQVKIKFPYYYDVDGKSSYVVNETPCSFAEDELVLIAKNKSGYMITIKYFEDLIKKNKHTEPSKALSLKSFENQ